MSLVHRRYRSAEHWISKLKKLSQSHYFWDVERLARTTTIMSGEGFLENMLRDEALYYSVDCAFCSGLRLEVTKDQIRSVGECALKSIGGLDFAVKVYKVIKEQIPDTELIQYAKLCASELNWAEAQEACKLVRDISPLEAWKACGGSVPNPIIQA